MVAKSKPTQIWPMRTMPEQTEQSLAVVNDPKSRLTHKFSRML